MRELISFFMVLLISNFYGLHGYYTFNKELESQFCHLTEYSNVTWTVKNCKNIILDSLTVPGGALLDLQLQNGTTLVLRGTTTFEHKEHHGRLVQITGNNVTIIGEKDSLLDGQGQLYWDGMGGWSNVAKPDFISFTLKNSKVFGITLLNCPQACSGFNYCENVEISDMFMNVSAGLPENTTPNRTGHNTDGIGISWSTNITLKNSIVINQDDCVVLGSASNITISNIYCYGGHGLSISQHGLDKPQKGAITENVLFTDSTVINSMNAIHVKTSSNSSTTGILRNITYRNIYIAGATDYGINIQQNYVNLPPNSNSTPPAPSNSIPIHNLNLVNVTGMTATNAVPVSVICAQEGCFDWKWSNVTVTGKLSDNNTCVNYKPKGFNNCILTNSTTDFMEME